MQFLGVLDKMTIPRRVINGCILPQNTRVNAASDISDSLQTMTSIISTLSQTAAQDSNTVASARGEIGSAHYDIETALVAALATERVGSQGAAELESLRELYHQYHQAANTLLDVAQADATQISVNSGDTLLLRVPLLEAASAYEDDQKALQAASLDHLSGQAIDSINQATAQSVSGTRQVEQEVKHLQDLAADLSSLVNSRAIA